MSFTIFIPARYESTRLPSKLLLTLAGKTLLQHAYECAQKAQPDRIIVATDNHKIANEAHKIGAEVVITSRDCPNGTTRIADAVTNPKSNLNFTNDDIIVNLQADEILMPKEYIQMVAYNLAMNEQASIATLAKPIKSTHDLLNHNIVKVVKNYNDMALYFSRSPVPYIRNGFTAENFKLQAFWHHIGLYSYKVRFLKEFNKLSITSLEQTEGLEQLRALWHGYNIHVGEVSDLPTLEINTHEDYLKAKKVFEPELEYTK